MSNHVIDIIERFQTRHALQEEQEMKNFNASRNGASTQGAPDKNAMSGKSMFETQKKHQHKGNPNQWRKSKMNARNGERFLYLQRVSQHQLIRGTEKSHACRLVAENNSPNADFS